MDESVLLEIKIEDDVEKDEIGKSVRVYPTNASGNLTCKSIGPTQIKGVTKQIASPSSPLHNSGRDIFCWYILFISFIFETIFYIS